MARASKLITVSVTSTPTGTTLASFVASMGVNTWAKWTGSSGAVPSLISPTGDDAVTSFAAQGCWDALNKRIVFIGQGHGTSYYSLKVVFNDATSTWTNSETPPVPAGTVSHGYNLTAVDPATGNVYFHEYGSHGMRRQAWNGAWSSTAADPLDGTDVSGGTQWNPYSNGGAGGVVFGNVYGIATYNPAANSWTKHTGITSAVQLSGYDNVSFYDPTAQSVYICGGSTNARSCVKVTAAGAFSQMGALPVDTGVPNGSSPSRAVTSSGWINPNNGSVVKPVLIGPTGCREYTSATDTWSASLVARPFTPFDGGVWYASISTYNCILAFVTQSGWTPEIWIWRRA